MNLRPRFLLLTVFFFALIAAPLWLMVRSMVEQSVSPWVVRFAEKQVLYDKSSTLQPILREAVLAKQLAKSPTLLQWARNPDNPALMREAFVVLERYRPNFQDKNYFVLLQKNGHYYYNSAVDESFTKEPRYKLDPASPRDEWFYERMKSSHDVHVNVSRDDQLGLTKLWIDIPIRDGVNVVGLIGTALDLRHFVPDMTRKKQPDASSLFVDCHGDVQIHRAENSLDFGVIKDRGHRMNRIRKLFDRDEDYAAVLDAMAATKKQDAAVNTLFITLKGKRYIVGVAWLEEIDWHEISLFDLDTLLPVNQFYNQLMIFVLMLCGFLLFFNQLLRYYVILPLKFLSKNVRQIKPGQGVSPELEKVGTGEIRSFIQDIVCLVNALRESNRKLESKLQERSITLERLSRIDSLTELLNRNGAQKQFREEFARTFRESSRMGVLWLNVDRFNTINNWYGHAFGDKVLHDIACELRKSLRPCDTLSRWSGDEFFILLPKITQEMLDSIGEHLREEVENYQLFCALSGEKIPITVSIGGHFQRNDDTIDSMLYRANAALFAAKAMRGNTYHSSCMQDSLSGFSDGPGIS